MCAGPVPHEGHQFFGSVCAVHLQPVVLPSAPPFSGTPTSVTYAGGVGKVTVLWQSPVTDPDPATTKYRLYAMPSTGGTRRLLGEGQTSPLELTPTSGSGTQNSPYNATAYLPGKAQPCVAEEGG